MICIDLIGRAHHENRISKVTVLNDILELDQPQLDQFCEEILGLVQFYNRTLGKWATDRPDMFDAAGASFYKIPFVTHYSAVDNVPGWHLVRAAYHQGHFSRQKLLRALEHMTNDEFCMFCSDILELGHQRTLIGNCYFADSPENLKLKDPTKDIKDFIFQVTDLTRGQLKCGKLIVEPNDSNNQTREEGNAS